MVAVPAAVQVILVSASLRETSLQTAKAWLDTDPIRVRSEAPAGSTPAARAAAAAVHPAANPKSEWAQMLPDMITHQVRLLLGDSNACCVQMRHKRCFPLSGRRVVSVSAEHGLRAAR